MNNSEKRVVHRSENLH